jgi:hypothetical protein
VQAKSQNGDEHDEKRRGTRTTQDARQPLHNSLRIFHGPLFTERARLEWRWI